MLRTPDTMAPLNAPVEKFEMLRNPLLRGERLRDIRLLQSSIERFGLLCPIIAVKRSGRLVVVDGRKRLAALRRMHFLGTLPRSLHRLPYLLIEDMQRLERRMPVMIANRPLVRAVFKRFAEDQNIDTIAAEFSVSRQCVRDILSLAHMAPTVRTAFFERRIDCRQARAFATTPDHDKQTQALFDLGYHATPRDIVTRVATGTDRARPSRPVEMAA